MHKAPVPQCSMRKELLKETTKIRSTERSSMKPLAPFKVWSFPEHHVSEQPATRVHPPGPLHDGAPAAAVLPRARHRGAPPQLPAPRPRSAPGGRGPAAAATRRRLHQLPHLRAPHHVLLPGLPRVLVKSALTGTATKWDGVFSIGDPHPDTTRLDANTSPTRWLNNGGVTLGSYKRETFSDSTWVAFLLDTACSCKSGGVRLRPEQRLPFTLWVGNPRKQVVSENVSHFRRKRFHRYRHLTLQWMTLRRQNYFKITKRQNHI